MMLARVCRYGISPTLASFMRAPVAPKPLLAKIQASRLFAADGRTVFTRSKRKTISVTKEGFSARTPITIGQGFVAGSALIGLGALCYYGLGLSSELGAIDYASLWPQYVKDRIRTTYLYFGANIGIAAASAAMCLRSPTIMRLVSKNSLVAVLLQTAVTIGSLMVVRSMPYQEGFGTKQVAWLVSSSLIGAFLAPLSVFGGPLLIRAAWYTAGIVGGLSAVAVCAPSEKFLQMGGALGIGLGVVFVSTLGGYFLPPHTAIGAGLYSVSMYGGLVLFCLLLLYNTQRVIHEAQMHPLYGTRPYDPINKSLNLYMDTLNIFIRQVFLLAGGKRK